MDKRKDETNEQFKERRRISHRNYCDRIKQEQIIYDRMTFEYAWDEVSILL